MRIVLLNTLYAPYAVGGAEVSTQTLAEQLVVQGHDVHVITLGEGVCEQRGELNGVKVWRLPLWNMDWPFRDNRSFITRRLWYVMDAYNPIMRYQVTDVLRRIKPDILHSNTLAGFSVSAWAACYSRAIPIVHSLRSYYLMCVRGTMMVGEDLCSGRCATCATLTVPAKFQSNRVSAVVGISRFVLQRHLAAGYFSEVEDQSVIYNATAVGDPAYFRDRGDAPLKIGYLGTIAPWKGVRHLIEAVRALDRRSYTLEIAGKGNDEYVQELKRICCEMPVHFLGQVNAQEFLRDIDVLAVPSQWPEPFGRVIIEAYSQGVPVLGADTGGIPELIRHEVEGFILPPRDVDAWHQALVNLSTNRSLLKEMKVSAYARSQGFGIEKHANQYLDIYRRLHATVKS